MPVYHCNTASQSNESSHLRIDKDEMTRLEGGVGGLISRNGEC